MTPGNTGTDVPAAGDHVYDPTNMGGATAAGPMEANTAGMTPGNTGATAAAMEANTAGMTPGNTGTNVPASGDHVYDPTNMAGTTAAAMEANTAGMTPGNTGATA